MRVVQERNSSNTPTVSYTRGSDLSGSLESAGGIGGLLARSHGYSSGNWTNHNCYHADGNGNITYLVNSSQTLAASYRYDPYGNTISSSGTLASANVYRFSSKELHVNSGLYYYGYRWYHPNLQRWLNRDPISDLAMPARLISEGQQTQGIGNFFLRPINAKASDYTVVNNSPLAWIDPFGDKPTNQPPTKAQPPPSKPNPKKKPPFQFPCPVKMDKDCQEQVTKAASDANKCAIDGDPLDTFIIVCDCLCKALGSNDWCGLKCAQRLVDIYMKACP
jgi:RHS repeat-associated protein